MFSSKAVLLYNHEFLLFVLPEKNRQKITAAIKCILVATDNDSLSKVIQNSIDVSNQQLSSRIDSVGVSHMKANGFSKSDLNTKSDLSSVLVSTFLLCNETLNTGNHVKVLWPDNNSFYPGILKYYDESRKELRAEYTYSKIEVLKMKNEILHHQHPKISNVFDEK